MEVHDVCGSNRWRVRLKPSAVRRWLILGVGSFFLAPALAAADPQARAGSSSETSPHRITILSDAFGPREDLQQSWGFAALVEYGGRRVLFDTGSKVAAFEHNVRVLGVDLTRLDAVVISHRHGDHTAGLTAVLRENPRVKIYTPNEAAFFGSAAPPGFFAAAPDLPAHLRYYRGQPPEGFVADTPWGDANFVTVTKPQEIFPGFFIFPTRSEKPGTLEMNEISLAIRTPGGLAVIAGCAHPGIEKILAEGAKLHSRLYTAIGGFHLVMTPPGEVQRVARVLHDDLKLARVAPGHCTSELGLVIFRRQFGDRFDEAGVGTVLALP